MMFNLKIYDMVLHLKIHDNLLHLTRMEKNKNKKKKREKLVHRSNVNVSKRQLVSRLKGTWAVYWNSLVLEQLSLKQKLFILFPSYLQIFFSKSSKL